MPQDKKKHDESTVLLHAVSHGYKEMTLELIEKCANLNEKDNSGNTALIWAAREGYTELALSLIEKGATLDEKDSDGNTALIWAAKKGHKEIVISLIEKGADRCEKNEWNETALNVVHPLIRDDFLRAIPNRTKPEYPKRQSYSISPFFERKNVRDDIEESEGEEEDIFFDCLL